MTFRSSVPRLLIDSSWNTPALAFASAISSSGSEIPKIGRGDPRQWQWRATIDRPSTPARRLERLRREIVSQPALTSNLHIVSRCDAATQHPLVLDQVRSLGRSFPVSEPDPSSPSILAINSRVENGFVT